MKKLTGLCGVALISFASINAQAGIQPMNDAALSEVEGQLGLIDSTRFIVGAHVVGAYVAHEAVEKAVRLKVAHEVVETAARIKVAHEIVETGVRLRIAHEAVETGVRLRVAHEVGEHAARIAAAGAAAGAAGVGIIHHIVNNH